MRFNSWENLPTETHKTHLLSETVGPLSVVRWIMVNDTFCIMKQGKKKKFMFDLRFTIRAFVETLVCFHVEYHVAFRALEARLVPCLKKNEKLSLIIFFMIHLDKYTVVSLIMSQLMA